MRSLYPALTLSPGKATQTQTRFWFVLSLVITLSYGIMALQEAFSSPYVVQDDARQHVFWMRRFLDPTLFPNDLIADYFQSVAPPGYAALYKTFAWLGVDPMLVNKLIPIVLGIIGTAYGFGVALKLLPIPLGAFLSSWLLNQYFWANDDLISATARGFMPPLMLAFIYYLLHREDAGAWLRSLLLMLGVIVLEGLFYPVYVLVFAGILVLLPVVWQQGRFRLSQNRRDYWFMGAGLVIAFLMLLPNVLESSPYGPVITAAEARKLLEFSPVGRSFFFIDDNPSLFWLSGSRSGILSTIRPPMIGLGVLLPLLMCFPKRFPLVKQISPRIGLLVRWGVVSLALFFLAHALLFRLYLPSRYTSYTLQLILVFETGIFLLSLWDAGLRWLQQNGRLLRRIVVWGFTAVIAAVLLLYPNYMKEFPRTEYRVGQYIPLYEFLARQPKDTLVASFLLEADSIGSFAQRSVYISREHAVPYEVGYANQFRQRANDLIRASYTLKAKELRSFINSSGVDYWLVSPDQFTPTFLQEEWIRQYPEAIADAQISLSQGAPALQRKMQRCTVLEVPAQPLDPVTQGSLIAGSDTWLQTRTISVVDSACLLKRGP